jgi:hypothetical protein
VKWYASYRFYGSRSVAFRCTPIPSCGTNVQHCLLRNTGVSGWRRTWTFYEDRYYDDTIRCYEIVSRIGVLERWKEQATDPAEIIKHSEQLGILLDMLQTVENEMIVSNAHFQSIGGVNSASSNHRIIVRNTPYQPRPPATVQVPESTEHKPAVLQCNNELTGVVL